jgi:hypothetical protein
MKSKKFEEKVAYIRHSVLSCYSDIDKDQVAITGMLDMLVESVLLLAEVVNKDDE